MKTSGCAASLDVDCARRRIDIADHAEVPIQRKRDLESRVGADAGLLGGEPVALHRTAFADDTPDVLQPRQSRLFVEQVLIRKLAQPVELPPGRLGLAAMPLEHV